MAPVYRSTFRGPDRRSCSRVLLVNQLFPPAVGGSAVLLHEIYSRLADLGVTVLTEQRADAVPTDRARGDRALTIVQDAVGATEWGVATAGGRRHYRHLMRRIRELARPYAGTIVHAGRLMPEGVAACLARLSGGSRYLVWTHGEDLTAALTSREFTLLARVVYRFCAGAIANSRNTAQLLERHGVPPNRIHIVYPAVDAARFSPSVDGAAYRASLGGADAIIVLSVGRLQKRKGHDVAIEAVARLAPACPQLRYVIIGEGEQRPRLEALAATLGVSRQVVFLGEVPAEALPQYYAASDIFLMPNRQEQHDIEGFGIVFLEAAASGRPAIGGASGGVPEAIEHGKTGLLVDGRDADSVAAAIRQLSDSPSLRARLGSAGRARVLEHFTWDRAAVQVRSIHHALGGRALPAPERQATGAERVAARSI